MSLARTLLASTILAGTAGVPLNASAQDAPLNVVSTIGMIADVASNVGGECVDSIALMGPGVDPHLYQATARDVQTFQDAELILYSGYSLEGQLGDVLERFSERTPTVAISPASIPPADLISVEDIYGIDPHLWMDVSLWAKIAPTIAGQIAELRPDCADTVAANTDAYVSQLEALDGWVEESIVSIPEEQRILVTAHDAFNYYGRAYGIEVAGIQGISTESEAGIADIREMAETVSARNVPAVFIESTINPRTIQAVIDAAAEAGHRIEIGGELYSDAMGEAGTAGGTYVGMIYENTLHITEALGGTPAPLPEALAAWAREWGVAE
ncbi:metal ABC transporter solute-binding protein, Zn/Mn family [Pelagibacterium xiamenense]|uniref:metal ABC transporter solute-binding protein, Zn/Mn family n=1 Tax=Pelagibacterium xiamenense TaxID=2901140 RepID=UPI001E293F6E|nr:zinc ABC transporter substrate-binding protein [Pelagibacterium xiamenense]MCD7058777.1 zinc ABC transporter substrate-binding protein [Pelagibacterium xiamenense]